VGPEVEVEAVAAGAAAEVVVEGLEEVAEVAAAEVEVAVAAEVAEEAVQAPQRSSPG
jgi:hypothetical protein